MSRCLASSSWKTSALSHISALVPGDSGLRPRFRSSRASTSATWSIAVDALWTIFSMRAPLSLCTQ